MDCKPITFRIVLIGNAQVGKTSIVKRLISKEFANKYIETVGAAFFSYTYTIEDKSVLLQIWDTAGQEKYQSLGPIYYRNAAAAIVVYDQSDFDSFKSISKWIELFYDSAGKNTLIFIVGNKNDLPDPQVQVLEAEQFAVSNNYTFLSVSAKTGQNIERLFQNVAQELVAHQKKFIPRDEPPQSENTKMTKSPCC